MLATEPQGSNYLHLPSTGIIGTHCHAQLFMRVLGSKQVLTASIANTFQISTLPPHMAMDLAYAPHLLLGLPTQESWVCHKANSHAHITGPHALFPARLSGGAPRPPAAFSVTLPTPGFRMLPNVITPLLTPACFSVVLSVTPLN